jgi:hypothetical protein
VISSLLLVTAILSIVAFLLIRERGNAQESATRAASNIVQLIDADVLRNVELYDLTLQGLIAASRRDDLKAVSPTIRHLALFDRSTAVPYKGDILLLDAQANVIADSASVQPRNGNYADREYFQSHVNNPDRDVHQPPLPLPTCRMSGASVSAADSAANRANSSASLKRQCA